MPLIITPDNSLKIDQLQEQISSLGINSLNDVDLTNIANGRVLKFNITSQKWECADDVGGISDVPDSQNYVRKNGLWILLSSTLEITDINLTLQDHETRIDTLETLPPPNL